MNSHFKNLINLFLFIISISLLLSGTATAKTDHKKRHLSPTPDIEQSIQGQNTQLWLTVENKLSPAARKNLNIENDLSILFLELFQQGFSRRGFSISPQSSDSKLVQNSTPVSIHIFKLGTTLKKSFFKTNIQAFIEIEIQIHNRKMLLTKAFKRENSHDVAFKASDKEIKKLLELTIAELIEDVVTHKEVLNFAIKRSEM